MVERAKQDLDREIITIRNVIDMIRYKDSESDEANTERLNLNELAEEAIGGFETQIKELSHPIDRRYSVTSPWIKMERETAELVIYQLFASILKYSNEGARLQVASTIEKGDCVLELTTRDNEQVDFPPSDIFTLEMESHRTGKLRCADLGLRVAHEMVVPSGGALSSERSPTSGTLRFRFPHHTR